MHLRALVATKMFGHIAATGLGLSKNNGAHKTETTRQEHNIDGKSQGLGPFKDPSIIAPVLTTMKNKKLAITVVVATRVGNNKRKWRCCKTRVLA